MSNLEHEGGESGGTDEAETSLDGASGASGLGKRGGGGVGRAGGRGAERAGHGHGAGGLDDGAVVAGSAGAGDVGAGADDGVDGGGVGGHGGGLDDRRRGNGVSLGRLDGVAGRAGGSDGVASGGGAGDRGDRAGRDNDGAVVLGDTELGGVLVLAGNVVDQLETVVGDIGLEGSSGSPGEGARVGNALGKSLDGEDVGRGATEKDKRNRVGGGWLPGDLEGLASRHNLGRSQFSSSSSVDFQDESLPRSEGG